MSFGSYGQAIHETNLKNSITLRTLGVVYLRESDTLQGGFEVMNLLMGKIISRRKVTPIQILE